jgi:hypothetical protein
VLHYRRQGDLLVPPTLPAEGMIRLDPPGIEIVVDEMLVEAAQPPKAGR